MAISSKLFKSVFLFTLSCVTMNAFGGSAPYLVKDINPMGFSSPEYMTRVGDRLFFNADDGVHGQELWVSDGTAAGTHMVLDLVPGADGSVPQVILELNGRALFQVDDNVDGMQWYISDGTAEGTQSVANVEEGGPGIAFETCGFWGIEAERVGSLAFFEGDDPNHGKELWRTDGSDQGTALIKDIRPGPSNGFIQTLTKVGNILYFASSAGGTIPGHNPWRSDGTEAGTVVLADLTGAIAFTDVGGVAFFMGENSTTGEELWASDGTPAGTRLVKDIYPGINSSLPTNKVDLNGILYFSAFSPGSMREIWRSDGTEEGTYMVVDLNPSGDGGTAYLTVVNDTLFFRRSDNIAGQQIWKSDGTAEGTVMVKVVGPPEAEKIEWLTAVYGKLYFAGDDGLHGVELWVSDGTPDGTHMVADTNPGSASIYPSELVAVGPMLYFKGGSVELSGGAELWAYDTREAIPAIDESCLSILASAILVAGIMLVRRRVWKTAY